MNTKDVYMKRSPDVTKTKSDGVLHRQLCNGTKGSAEQ